MAKSLNFNRPKSVLPLTKGQDQGLKADTVNLRGNKPSKFKYLTAPSKDFPGDNPSGRLARGDGSVSSVSSSGGASQRDGKKKARFDKIANLHNRKKKTVTAKAPRRVVAPAPPMIRRAAPSSPVKTFQSVPAPMDISDDSGAESDSYMSDSDDAESVGGQSYASFASSASSFIAESVQSDASSSIFSGRMPAGKPGPPRSEKPGNVFKGMSSTDAEEAEKADLLARFHFLRQRGTHISKNYTAKSSLNEMRLEIGRIEHENQVKRAVKMNQRFLLAGVSAVENISNNYGPKVTKGKLYRVSHFVQESIHDYDSAFERMAEEYGGVVGAITGGNPIYEIVFTALYQMFIYAMFYRGAESAQANEELTIEDIKKRFPALIKEAGEQYARENGLYRPVTHVTPEPQQPVHAVHQQQPHSVPITGQGYPSMAPPSNGLMDAYMARMSLNAEDPGMLQYLNPAKQTANQSNQGGTHYTQAQQPHQSMPPPDIMLSEMHQPLPRVHEEDEEEEDSLMSMPLSTRTGRPPKVNEVPRSLAELTPIPPGDVDDDDGKGDGDLVIDIK